MRIIKTIIEDISASSRVDKIIWTKFSQEYLENLGENSCILKMLEDRKRELKFIRQNLGKDRAPVR